MSTDQPLLQWFTIAAVLVAFVTMSGVFASNQTIWVDETTQLSGLALPFTEQLLWLIGLSDVELGVPPDRMPPLSYWIGGLWVSLFGLSETAMRWFGIFVTLAAAPALYLSGRKVGGIIGGIFATALVLLSPNTLVMAGEIRAYPLFLTLSAWSVWAFLRCLEPGIGNRTPRLAVLSVFLVIASYTHFFGVVLAAALFATLVVHRILFSDPLRPILLMGVCGAISLIGLAPFVLGALAVSSGEGAAAGTTVREAATAGLRLFPRLVFHGSHGVYIVVLVGTGLGLLGLAALSLWRSSCRTDGRHFSICSRAFLLLPLVIAAATLPVLEYFIGNFSVLSANYNIWMIPLMATFLVGAFANRTETFWSIRIAHIFAVTALLGHLIAGTILLRHAAIYVHGPGEWVTELWREMKRPAIIHDGKGRWGHAYFPLHFLSEGTAVQFLQREDGTLWQILPGGLDLAPNQEGFLSAFKSILYVRVGTLNSRDLAQVIRGDVICGAVAHSATPSASLEHFCAYASASATVIPTPRSGPIDLLEGRQPAWFRLPE